MKRRGAPGPSGTSAANVDRAKSTSSVPTACRSESRAPRQAISPASRSAAAAPDDLQAVDQSDGLRHIEQPPTAGAIGGCVGLDRVRLSYKVLPVTSETHVVSEGSIGRKNTR